MKILILGASGIIGQHMRLCVPKGVEPVWHRRGEDLLHVGFDLADLGGLIAFLDAQAADVIVNLAGESRPDVVENSHDSYTTLNHYVASFLGCYGVPQQWRMNKKSPRIVHVSTQAVLGGGNSPYSANQWVEEVPANRYGLQKRLAEQEIWNCTKNWTIVRPTFVLGVRPMPAHGRQNPIEAMLEGQLSQVDNRWFSVSFARDVAEEIWKIATGEPLMKVVHLGVPLQTSRYEVAKMAGVEAIPCKHEDFPGIAPRPIDTTYAGDSQYAESQPAYHSTMSKEKQSVLTGIGWCVKDHQELKNLGEFQRARELSIFFGMHVDDAFRKLSQGFGPLHQAVAEDFRAANPQTDDELLNWYRTTEAYIWELSAYHCNPAFNYMGMCKGIAERLDSLVLGLLPPRVLSLGDGIGDLTLSLSRVGFETVYHDLKGSRTAAFAKARFYMYGCGAEIHCTGGWEPCFGVKCNHDSFGAIVSLDFLEHVTDVPTWAAAIHRALVPGGIFVAQNAFGLGNQEGGSMPMHLNRNDRFVTDWDPLLFSLGFEQLGPQWYRKKP